MIKRVNFTGRKRIPKDCTDIVLNSGTPRTFDAAIDLSSTTMPDEAKVFLEAMCSGSSLVKRFDFGNVGSISNPGDRSLGEIQGENVFFVLKVVDENERLGRILGISENLRPHRAGERSDAGKRGLLPVDEKPLGQELWVLDYGEHEVSLIVNSEIPGLRERSRWDPLFYSLVYPAVVRMILHEAIDRGATPEDDDDRWPTLWLRFGQGLHHERAKPPVKEEGEDEIREWVSDVVTVFSESHSLRDQYTKTLPSVSGEDQ